MTVTARPDLAPVGRRPALGRLVLTLLALPLVALGWSAGATVTACWAVASWAWAAVQVGWDLARRPTEGGGP